jgi:hypothetical protein
MKYESRLPMSCAASILALASLTPLAFAGKTPDPEPPEIESPLLVASATGNVALASARVTTRDVGDRLFRMRAGLRPMEHVIEEVAPASGGKGGMTTTRTVSSMNCWEVYGSLFYYTEEQDSQLGVVPGIVGGPNGGLILLHPDTDLDIFGGSVGIERHFNENWSAGLALSGSNTDVDMTFAGSSDVDTFAVTPYISYYRADAFGTVDFWADIMYSHGFHEFDIQRFSGAGLVEFTTGVNFQSGNVTHGPYAGLRWIDGTVDSYNEIGAGGLSFPEQDVESLASTLGYQLSFPVKTSTGTLVPQVRGAWEHEFEDDGNNILGLTLGERDEDLAVFGAGIGYYCNSGWNTVLDYEGRLGSEVEGHYVSLKVGKEF